MNQGYVPFLQTKLVGFNSLFIILLTPVTAPTDGLLFCRSSVQTVTVQDFFFLWFVSTQTTLFFRIFFSLLGKKTSTTNTLFCVLPSVYHLLCTTSCVLPSVYYLLCTTFCVLPSVYYLLQVRPSVFFCPGTSG